MTDRYGSSRLGLPYLQAAQAQKHVTHNEALERLDTLVQLAVETFEEGTPPVLPEEGQVWVVGAPASGAWAGHTGEIAAWVGGGWLFMTPQSGWHAANGADFRVFDGTGWVAPAPNMANVPGAGINANYDTINRLAVSAPATLLNHEGEGHQLKVNKSAPGDTASLLFQTGFEGRSEMGIIGDDDFSLKVSQDGSGWTTALQVDHETGTVSLPNGLSVAGACELPGLRSDSTDTGLVTLGHTCAVIASVGSRASGSLSFVLCSSGGSANSPGSGVFCSASSETNGRARGLSVAWSARQQHWTPWLSVPTGL